MGGCAASKLADEDAVRRCRDRRRLIKHAVGARHRLAAAHSDYLRSLLLVASSLSSFAAGEPLAVSSSSPSVLLPRPPLPRSPTPASASSDRRRRSFPPNPPSVSTEDCSSSAWNWEDYYPPSPPGSEFFAGEGVAGREAAQCGRDRFVSSSSSDIAGSDDEGADLESRTNFELRDSAAESEIRSSSAADGVAGMELVVSHRDLAEIMATVVESFNGAAAAGEPVSVLLETSRKQLDRSIGQLRSENEDQSRRILIPFFLLL